MRQRWSVAEITAWYEERPWITGCNFIPSGAVHGTFWLLQEHDHAAAFRDAAREIAFAHWIGLNSIRFFLPFGVWLHQRDAFFAHLDELLALLDGYGMTMMPVLFDDCTVPQSRYTEPTFGPQPEPEPGFFGGSSQSPFDDDVQGGDQVGYLPFDEPGSETIMREYVQALADRYGQDQRILVWDVWNEIGNSSRVDRSLSMMTDVFAWLREADVAQPLTACLWGGGAETALSWILAPTTLPEVELRAAELSDLVTFHYYGDYLHAKQFIAHLRTVAGGRPLVNTEWMHRPFGSLVETHLPLWRSEDIGSYFFGLVNGKPQFDVVWTFIKGIQNVDTSPWMHDIVHSDFTPYDPDEIAVLRRHNLGELPLTGITRVSVSAEPVAEPVHERLFAQFFEHMAAATEGGLSAELLANPTLVRDPGLTAAQIELLVRNERLAQTWVATGDAGAMREHWASAPLHGGFPVSLVEEPRPGVPLGWAPLGWSTAVRPCVGRVGDGVLVEAAAESTAALQRDAAALDEAPGLRQGVRVPTHRCRAVVVDVVARTSLGEGTLEVLLRRRTPATGQRPAEPGEVFSRSTVTVGSGAWAATQHHLEVPPDVAPVELVDLFVRWHGSRTDDPSTTAHLLLDRVSAMPADHLEGFDPDVIAVARAARISEVRWPGGNFASHYHWRDGIGPVRLRPTRPNPAWGGIEQNTIGTEEFLAFCRLVGATPHLTVNSGTGDAHEAAAWVAYCNGAVDTPMGALRATGGHPEPHDVRVWEVGNENFGSWQGGFVGSEENARRFAEFAPAMRAASPVPLEVHACGNLFDAVGANKPLDLVDHDGRWHAELLQQAPDDLDVVSLHALSINDRYLDGLSEEDVHHALMAYPVTLERTVLPSLFAQCDSSDRDPARDPVRVSMTEWGPVGARKDRVRVENAGGGLWGFDLLGTLCRFGSRIAMASPNGLLHGGSIKKGAGVVYTDPVFDCVVRMRELVGQVPVAVHIEGPTFDVEHPTDLGLPEVAVPTVGVTATMSAPAGAGTLEGGRLTCILVSRRLTGSDTVQLVLPPAPTNGGQAEVSLSQWRPASVGVIATPAEPAPVSWVTMEADRTGDELVVTLPALAAVWVEATWSA